MRSFEEITAQIEKDKQLLKVTLEKLPNETDERKKNYLLSYSDILANGIAKLQWVLNIK